MDEIGFMQLLIAFSYNKQSSGGNKYRQSQKQSSVKGS
jgi:hypothetical protein